MLGLWRHLPVLVRAVLTGTVVALVGTTPWALLVKANLAHGPAVPWALLPAVLYLWLWWRYMNGHGWPASTSQTRRASLRARDLPSDVWGVSLFAGSLGLGALVLLFSVVNRLVRLPAQNIDDLSRVPLVTQMGWLLMGSAVAGIVEEGAFRGYMQGPIERRHGPVVAILVTGSLFGFAHFTHPEVTLALLPYFLTVAAIYGALAYFTNSIWPSLVLHAGGNVLSGLDLLGRGHAEWQTSSTPKPLIWETGADAAFWMSCVALLLVAGATVWAYAALANVARHAGEPVASN